MDISDSFEDLQREETNQILTNRNNKHLSIVRDIEQNLKGSQTSENISLDCLCHHFSHHSQITTFSVHAHSYR
jgi:hypothetical protein